MDELLDTGVDSVPDEPVQEPVVPTEPPAEEVVEVEEPVTYYSPEGDVVLLSEAPSPSGRTINVGSSITGTPYRSVTSGTYADMAAQLVPKVGFGDDYLFVCTDSNEYCFIWGDLAFSSGCFTADSCEFVRFYQSDSHLGTQMESGTASLNVSMGNYIGFSSLGDYPTLSTTDVPVTALLVVLMVVLAGCYVLGRVTSFVLRPRYGGVSS